jgi:hypothetical protein
MPEFSIPKPNSYSEIVSLFGDPTIFGATESAKAIWEQQFMTQWRADRWSERYQLSWPKNFPFRNLYVNRAIIPLIDHTMRLLKNRNLLSEIVSYDGCWSIRPIRGSKDKWSVHSFGLAIDFNAAKMPLGSPSTWSSGFVRTMEEAGWTWGGRFKRLDPMHFQYADNA